MGHAQSDHVWEGLTDRDSVEVYIFKNNFFLILNINDKVLKVRILIVNLALSLFNLIYMMGRIK